MTINFDVLTSHADETSGTRQKRHKEHL